MPVVGDFGGFGRLEVLGGFGVLEGFLGDLWGFWRVLWGFVRVLEGFRGFVTLWRF